MSNNYFLTPQTATMVLAYLHHYTCNFLPKRCLAASHLNHLAGWISRPVSGLRTARAHKPLAAHLALLHAAGLLDTASGIWICTPATCGVEAQAQTISADLQAAIHGRDACFPSEQPVAAELVVTIQEAINTEKHLSIAYQSLVDHQPHHRRVEPHRLEQRGELTYLHAYCYLAEADRIFRLDRIHNCQILGPDEGWEK